MSQLLEPRNKVMGTHHVLSAAYNIQVTRHQPGQFQKLIASAVFVGCVTIAVNQSTWSRRNFRSRGGHAVRGTLQAIVMTNEVSAPLLK